METQLAQIQKLVPTIVKQYSAQKDAIKQERHAKIKILQTALKEISPAIPSLSSKMKDNLIGFTLGAYENKNVIILWDNTWEDDLQKIEFKIAFQNNWLTVGCGPGNIMRVPGSGGAYTEEDVLELCHYNVEKVIQDLITKLKEQTNGNAKIVTKQAKESAKKLTALAELISAP